MKRMAGMVLAAWLAGGAFAAPVVVELRPVVTVTPGQMTLGQIAVVKAEDAALAEQVRSASLGVTPLPGVARGVSREQVAVALNRFGIPAEDLTFAGPRYSSVTVPTATISGERVVRTALEHLRSLPVFQRDGVHLEVERAPQDRLVAAPTAEIQMTATGTALAQPWGRATVYVRVEAGERLLATIPLIVRATCRTRVLHAREAIRRDDVVSEGNVELREMVLGPDQATGAFITDLSQALGKKAARAIPKDTPLVAGMVTEPFVVRRGDGVAIVVRGHNLEIVAKGTCLGDGSVGSMVPVKILASGKTTPCRVMESGRVEIGF